MALRSALRHNLNLSAFWAMAPWEFGLWFKELQAEKKAALRQGVSFAWLTAAWGPGRKIPTLDEAIALVSGEDQAPREYPDPMALMKKAKVAFEMATGNAHAR